MDNERKVGRSRSNQPDPKSQEPTDLVEYSKLVFLREIVDEFKRGQQQYDAQEEFARTRKNRSLFVPLTILGLVVVFGAVSLFVTRMIQEQSRSIEINIQDFQDVNLREILDQAQRLQNELDQVQRRLDETIRERDNAIQQIERNREREINLLQEANIAASERNSREQTLRNQAQEDIAEVQAEYQPQIEELQTRIAELEEQIAEYDARQLEQAREQEEVLNNQQRVFELEKEQLREEYESRIERLTTDYEQQIQDLEEYQEEFERTIRQRHAEELASLREQHAQEIENLNAQHAAEMEAQFRRFNPTFSGATARLLSRSFPSAVRDYGGLGEFRTVLEDEGAVGGTDYRVLVQRYDELQQLLNRLDEIPYENSIPTALEQIDLSTRELIRANEQWWRTLGDSVESRDQIIATRESVIAELESRIRQYRFALEEFSRINGDTGYVLDPRDPEQLVVYLTRIRDINAGNTAIVFRTDDEYIGRIEFFEEGDRLLARVVELAPERTIQPYDKILVQVQ